MSSLKFKSDAAGGFTLSCNAFHLKSACKMPVIDKIRPEELKFSRPTAKSGTAGNSKGEVFASSAKSPLFSLERQFFISNDKKIFAAKLAIENTGPDSFKLSSLSPALVKGNNLKVADAALDKWKILRMSRHKNDVPGVYRPSVIDWDFIDAEFSSAGVKAGMGVADAGKKSTNELRIISEPCISIRRDGRNVPGLFIGVLGQTRHLSSISVKTAVDRKNLDELETICEFDNILVEKGDRRETHWIVFMQADDEMEALKSFADMLASEMKFKPSTRKKPNFFCSWQFYGEDLREADVKENLKSLKQNKIPIDAFLLDNGWMDNWGSYETNLKRFPHGMEYIADMIRKSGFEAGIWTCPFVVERTSPVVKQIPGLFARDSKGEMFPFACGREAYVVDPTSPYAEEYLTKLYTKLVKWGFTYHKLDFLRALIVEADKKSDIVFHDPKCTRAEAYRRGMTIIRKALKDCYLIACGGIYEGSIGLCDANRAGADVYGGWFAPERDPLKRKDEFRVKLTSHLRRIKQNVFRNYMNKFWHSDPDALMLRRRTEPFRGDMVHYKLSEGHFTDEEAFTCVVNHYLGGGLSCFSDRIEELPKDRMRMLRHVSPQIAPPAKVIDTDASECPSLFFTELSPASRTLGTIRTIAAGNWEDFPVKKRIYLKEFPLGGKGRRYSLYEFRTRKFLGIKKSSDILEIEIPPHGMRLIRLAEFTGKPVILGTDMHLSGGGCELADVKIKKDSIQGKTVSRWNFPVSIKALFPSNGKYMISEVTVKPGRSFKISCN
ncbi:MAG: hypothetical protein A2X48_13470 [Lentisphaerae bacterium GWF2_49_21]|nr:MAG: hypothetical protein A2X48_13470 [Lentisphaerae bacterium GWF2_49_21]